MVDADISDDRDFGRDDVGAVEATTKTNFDDSNVDILLSKVAESHCRGNLEERGLKFGNERLSEFDKFANSLFGNHFAIDAYAFAEIFEVRRGVEAYFVASRLEYGGGEMRATAFAIGACDVDGTEFAVWVLEYFVEGVCGFESGFVGAFTYVLEHRCLIIKYFDSVIVIHNS